FSADVSGGPICPASDFPVRHESHHRVGTYWHYRGNPHPVDSNHRYLAGRNCHPWNSDSSRYSAGTSSYRIATNSMARASNRRLHDGSEPWPSHGTGSYSSCDATDRIRLATDADAVVCHRYLRADSLGRVYAFVDFATICGVVQGAHSIPRCWREGRSSWRISQLSCLAPGVLSRGDIINFLHGVGVAADELFYGRDLCCGSGRLYVVDQYSIASVCVCSTRSVTQRVGTDSSPDRTATSRNRYSDVSNNGFYKCSVAGTALGPSTRYVSGSVL